MKNFEYGVIGAGPAGFAAATGLARRGHTVVLFEREEIGGTCLNKGCIPTKTYLHTSDLLSEIKNSENVGIFAENPRVDFEKLRERKDKVVQTMRNAMSFAVKNLKIEYVHANAEIVEANVIEADCEKYNCEKIFVATGAKPRNLKGLERDGKFIMNSDDILEMLTLPKSMVIVGSGAIGIEWTRIFSNLGVEVTLLELAEHLLPLADIEVSKRIERIFKMKKIKFYTSTSISKIENKKVFLSNGEELDTEIVFVGVGREIVKPEIKGEVTVLGDAYGSIQLAHFAMHQAVEAIGGAKFNHELTPSIVYGEPEIAWIGKREQDLEPDSYQKSVLLITSEGKAHCDNATEGFVKILVQDGKIVGAHIVSKEASALIHEVLIGMQNDVSVEKMKEICFAHPTYSESIFDALMRLK